MIDLLIFDNDGTLVDSELLCQVALAREIQALPGAGAADLDPQVLSERYRGWELARVLGDLSARLSLTLDDDFVPRYRRRISDLMRTDLQPMPGVHAALDALAGGLPRCVASGGPREKIELSLSVTGLRHHFGDALFSSYEVGSFKPEPGLFLHVAEQLGVTPGRCLVVEDSAVGVTAARRAGMPVVHVAADARDADGVHALGRIDGLPALLARLSG